MKKNIVLIASSVFLIGTFFAGILSDNGKAGVTGSPGENNCTQCHNSFTVNSGTGSVTISSDMTNWEYVPGQTYQISVTVAQSNIGLFGLGFEALQSSGANAGTLTPGTGTQIKNALIGGNQRANIVHTLNGGASSNSHTFNFTWTAPSTNVGVVTFYAAGNAANDNGSDTGDRIYTASQIVNPASVGIQEAELTNAFIGAYPNPFNSSLQVQYTLKNNANIQINVMDLTGKIVLSESLNKGNGAHTELLNAAELSNGLYIVSLFVDGKVLASQRVVKK
jgi:Secretion system C-terminal sorting domain